MKRFALPLTLLLPVLAAATSAAQIAPLRFIAPVNPVAGLPKLLPSPLTGPLVGSGINLPSLVPALTPSLRLTPAAPQIGVILPVRMPSRDGQFPTLPTTPSRDGVNNPIRRVIPGVVIRFNGAPAQPGAATPEVSKEKLDHAFDGDLPSKPVVGQMRRQPITSGRHITLPEWDLERELGI
jgi:hypothetical protein